MAEKTLIPKGASKKELAELVKSLKLYRTLRKKLGNRGVKLFAAIRSGEKVLRIERHPEFDQKDAEAALIRAFGKDYDQSYTKEWKENPSLKGGLRAFFGDEMVDFSFSHVERTLSSKL